MVSAGPSSAFVPSGFFVFRAPVLPFDILTAPQAPDGDTGEASRARLRRLLDLPAVSEAVFVASPSLHAQLDAWRRDPDSETGKKVEQALVRYVARMAGRATPFGLFAGCSTGAVGKGTRLSVGEPCRHTRLDMDYVVLLADALAHDPELRPALRFSPNSSLYRVAGRARYREVRRKDKGWTHHRAVLEVPDYLEAVLARAADGATPGELTRALLDHDPEATEAEAAEYVADLIAQQVLVSELVPAVTGAEPVHGLIERLQQLPAGAAAAERLGWVRDELLSLDARAPGAPPDRYRAIAARLAELPAQVDESRLFQVDLMRPDGDATLGENVVAEITRGVELLRRLMPRPADDPLAAFRQAFAARFGDTEVTREVPLAEALDDETGVGFAEDSGTIEASSLLEGLELSLPPESRVAWGPREAHLLGRVTEALARGEQELTLTEKDIERMAVKDPLPLPDAFAAILRLEAASGDAVARGDFRLFLQGAMGPSGARLLGRFCHSDPDLAAAVERHLRAEEALRPDAVFAEVVHLPEGRVGNILARPACRAYEIPYLGRSGAPADRQIPLSDLRVSVNFERVVLRSARLGREVVPRLTSAHNFGTSTGVYRFLCALQGQGVAPGLGWDWGPLAGSAFLPRVAHGRLVLARAQWRVTPEEASRLREAGFSTVRRWREERRLPRWVCLVEGDNELPIDLDDRLMAETLLGGLRENAILTELFPAPDLLCATGPLGRYVHEMVVPFVRREAVGARGPAAAPQAPSHHARRVFPPGSEWLALKLYAGTIVVDHLVRDVVGPLAARLVAEGRATRWFFVRYADPHGHLRVRFRGPDALAAVQEAVAPLLAEGRIWKVQIDTYEREIERYGGGAGIDACEEIFWRDSEAIVELIRLPEEDGRGDRRWRLALLGMDRLLGDMGLDLEGRHAVLRRARDAWRAEFRTSAEAAARVGAKYRAESAALADLLGTGPDWSEARAVLDRRSEGNAPAAAALRAAAGSGVEDIAGSLLHMHVNRLLRSAPRIHELVLYDFLCRHYEGRLARRSGAGGGNREAV